MSGSLPSPEALILKNFHEFSMGFWKSLAGKYQRLGGGSKYFLFSPLAYLGKIPILTNIFQLGWNHHLEDFDFWFLKIHPTSPSLQVRIYTPAATSVPTPGLAMGPGVPIFVAAWSSRSLAAIPSEIWNLS